MNPRKLLALTLTLAGLLCWQLPALADCPALDTVDIGNPSSESGHNLQHWGPIEPATSGGSYGGIADCRPIYAPEDGDDWATLDLDFGDDPSSCKELVIKHLDGLTKDSFEVWIGGVLVYAYAGDELTSENWYETTVMVCGSGVQTVKLVSTAPQWAQWSTYGQMCFDVIEVRECPGDCTLVDMVDVGDTSSESGHNPVGWGPVEPATSGGSYGGIDNCRPVYAPEDGTVWATIDLDFGDDPLKSKCLTFHHLEGIAVDAFELYVYPQGQPAAAQLIHTYAGDAQTAEIWMRTSILVPRTGVQTLKFVSTSAQWTDWARFGQMCIDVIRVDECPRVKDSVDIGKPASEAGHNPQGWGPIEPAASGGNYGGIDDCRAAYASLDNDAWASLDMDFGCCEGQKCVVVEHLDGATKDAFDLYMHPPGDPGSAQLILSYPGDDLTTELWLTSTVLVQATGVQTLRFVSTQPKWSSWATYGQMCFNNIRVEDYVPLKDVVLIGDTTSETGHNLVGWGPVEPATSGGTYGGIDRCRPIYAPEDNDACASLEMDFGWCVCGTKCLTMYHLDGIAKDAFDVYIYPPGGSRPATPAYSYAGDSSSSEMWFKTSFAVNACGRQVVEFVSTEPTWSGWATYGQVCFTELQVQDCAPHGPQPYWTVTGVDPGGATPAALAGRILSIAPNPFNPKTEIRFALIREARVELAVYDIRGQHMATLVDRQLPAGAYSEAWNGVDASGKRAASGMYFVLLRCDSAVMQVVKTTLIK